MMEKHGSILKRKLQILSVNKNLGLLYFMRLVILLMVIMGLRLKMSMLSKRMQQINIQKKKNNRKHVLSVDAIKKDFFRVNIVKIISVSQMTVTINVM